MRHPDEIKLLKEVAVGDADAFKLIYEHYSPSVYSFILKYLKSPELSDDICQNVFIKIWEQREQLATVLQFSAWAFTIAKCQSLDFLRRASREHTAMATILQSYQSISNDPENGVQTGEYLLFIERVLKRMPEQTQLVFKLCRQESMSYEEAAAELGISRNAIKKHMVRSMRILKEAAEKELGVSFSIILVLLSSRF